MGLKNDTLLKALRLEPVSHTPLWMMRQAGRYLPEYRKVRKNAGDFLSLCKNPDFATEVTLQPIKRYGFDAAILFSDILTIPDAMGLGLYFEEGEGPKFKHPTATPDSIAKLRKPMIEESLSYVTDAVRSIKSALNNEIPLIGFSGSPFTLATYMIEGGSTKQFLATKKLRYQAPEAFQNLLNLLADTVSEYLLAQIEAGADVAMIFDTWGSVLSYQDYLDYSLTPMKKILTKIKAHPKHGKTPVMIFTKGGTPWLNDMAESGAAGIGLDWTLSLSLARKTVGNNICLQGNLDPQCLEGSDQLITQEVKRIITENGQNTGHIFNLGHGITPNIHPDKVAVMVDAVRKYGTY